MKTIAAPKKTKAQPEAKHRKAQDLPPPNDQFVQSFARGLAVIRAFGPKASEMTLTEVADRTGLTRAGARRILLTLQHLGYVAANDRKFYLTPRILDLGYSYLSSMKLWDFAEPAMEELVDKVHESCSVSVLDGTEIVYVLRVPTRKIMTINLSIGSRLPAFCTSMGRVLLGDLEETALDTVLSESELKPLTKRTVTNPTRLKKIIAEDHKKGWSLIDQELEEGLCSIAVPLIDSSGHTIAAMNIGGNVTRTSGADLIKKVLPELQAAANKINTALRLRRS
jgi:IclR family transcriptional regulator, pca regulon regulatory protein